MNAIPTSPESVRIASAVMTYLQQHPEWQEGAPKVLEVRAGVADLIEEARADWTSAELRAAADTLKQLRELLAIIHRDGGHHTDKVGIEQSVNDAHQVWAKLRIEVENNGLK